MFILVVIGMLLFIGASFTQQWLFVAAFYLLSGFLWIIYDKRIPQPNRPMYTGNTAARFLMVLLWPLRLFAVCQEYIFFRKQRFTVIYGPPDKLESSTFQSYENALAFAREKAKNIKVYRKVTIADAMHPNKGYMIRPNGRVDEI